MNESTSQLTPQARLAISRQAIVRHMHHDDERDDERDDDQNQPKAGQTRSLFSDAPLPGFSNTWTFIKRAARSWWQHQPASAALDLAKPLLGQYAKEQPVRLMAIAIAIAIAMGAGAAVVVFKPWRLISLGGVLLAVMKSSALSGAVFSMLSPSPTKKSSQ